MIDILGGEHLAHVALAARIADHAGAAAHQRDGAMARALHVRHGHNRDIMADVQAVGGGVEADVKRGRLLELLVQLVLKRDLGDESALLEYIENMHGYRTS